MNALLDHDTKRTPSNIPPAVASLLGLLGSLGDFGLKTEAVAGHGDGQFGGLRADGLGKNRLKAEDSVAGRLGLIDQGYQREQKRIGFHLRRVKAWSRIVFFRSSSHPHRLFRPSVPKLHSD